MPDTVKKPKLDDRTIVARMVAMGGEWDHERRVWSVANDRRPALLQLLDEAGYAVEWKGKPEAEAA
jgi:DNA-binding transcriptional MocR family regulator